MLLHAEQEAGAAVAVARDAGDPPVVHGARVALGFKARRLAFAPSLLGCEGIRRAACRLVRLELQE